MEIGIDCVDIERFLNIESDSRLLKKIYTPREIDYCKKRKPSAQHFAVRFAAKEATIKALSYFGISLSPNKIEIDNDDFGRPRINLPSHLINRIVCKVSMSHSNHVAIAQTIINEI